MSVKSALPTDTWAEWASAVRRMPWMIHGWRPSSAVIQPAVFAMNGKGSASSSAQSTGRAPSRRPRQSRKAASPMSPMKSVPSPAMTW